MNKPRKQNAARAASVKRIKLTEDEHARFWVKVNKLGRVSKSSPKLGRCWIWTAGIWARGYGAFCFRNGQIKSHRLSFLTKVGSIPSKTPFVLHHCDVRRCVRPTHLFLGTYASNAADCKCKGRHKTVSGDDHYYRKHPEKIRRGTQLPQAKLTEKLVAKIRAEHARGNISQLALSLKYDVTTGTISMLLNRITWIHVR